MSGRMRFGKNKKNPPTPGQQRASERKRRKRGFLVVQSPEAGPVAVTARVDLKKRKPRKVEEMNLADELKAEGLADTPFGRSLLGPKPDIAKLKSQYIREQWGLT